MITILLLLAAGLLGIITHNLMKIRSINLITMGRVDWGLFFQSEWPTMAISVCVLLAALISRAYIQEFVKVGSLLAPAFYAIGLSSQSVVYFIMGKTGKILEPDKKQEPPIYY